MNLKRFIGLIVIMAVALALTSCVLSASKAPAATPTLAQGNFPLPGQGTPAVGMVDAFKTQTAVAALGGMPKPVTNATNTPVPPPPAVTATQVPPDVNQPQPTQVPPQPPAPQVVVPTATPGVPKTYTLQKDEFPYCIARRFNVNPYTLLSLNGLNASSVTYAGTVLKIPQDGKTFPGERAFHKHPASYTVKAGDNIYSVACYFGDVDPMMIALANSLKAPYTLSSGQVLQIP